MRYQLIEYTPRKNKIWIYILVCVICIIIMTISWIIASKIMYNKNSNENLKQNSEQKNDNASINIEKENVLSEEIKTKTNKKIPVYSEETKEEMKHIYASDTKRVFLTFDDGPSELVTPLILDVLKEYNVKATFFVLGSRVELHPEILKREYEEGHYIANHGYSHQYSSIYATPNNVLDEYMRTENCIKEAIGVQEYNSHLFRFPGGSTGGVYSEVKREAIEILNQNDIEHIDWNALTKDAEGKHTKEEMLQSLIETSEGKNSVVVLMHDTGNKVLTYEMLPSVIEYFRNEGYEFKTFYDIMQDFWDKF